MNHSLQHSSEVDIFLVTNGKRIEVSSCLQNRCRIRNPLNISPCSAELVIVIDGHERRKPIYLSNGISAGSCDIEFEPMLSEECMA